MQLLVTIIISITMIMATNGMTYIWTIYDPF